jgi:dTDP-4-amino-4,6-dideoxygalactose transaminase
MIPLFKVFMSEEAILKASDVLRSGYIGQGPVVDEFEYALQNFLSSDYVCTTNSATSAEHLLYHLLKKPAYISCLFHGESDRSHIHWNGLQSGDEVLATPLTCTATNWPILANNLKIKWVDIDPETLSLDLSDLRRKLSPSTKLISVVHWGGYPADLAEIRKIQLECQSKFGFVPLVIEDCAHALGSSYKGNAIGSHGNFSTFSFQAIKHVTSVDGGALVLPDQNLFKRSKLLRWYGIDRESNRKDFRCEADISEWGFKFHMNDVSAAIGLENLKLFENISSGFKRCRDFYRANLTKVDGIQLIQNDYEGMRNWNPWLFSILVDNKDSFYKAMHSRGISVSQVHERNDKHSCVDHYKSLMPSLDSICQKLICIPCGWWVSDDDLQYIVQAISEGW